MVCVNEQDLYTAVQILGRLPDRYITAGHGVLSFAIYLSVTRREKEVLNLVGIKTE